MELLRREPTRWKGSDDVVRSNPELRGRVTAIDMTYWSADELEQIAFRGWGAFPSFSDWFGARSLTIEQVIRAWP